MSEKLLNLGVWEDTAENGEISRRGFFFNIGAFLTYGFILTFIIGLFTADINVHKYQIALIITSIVSSFAGILISAKSDKPLFSFIGFNLVVLGTAIILGPIVNIYAKHYEGVVSQAIFLTAIITFVQGFTGVLIPDFYKKIGGALFIGLLALVIIRLIGLFIPALNFGWLSYIAAGIFALYIGYDFYRASVIRPTVDNAIDIAISLYLDIINLFLELLKILAASQKRN